MNEADFIRDRRMNLDRGTWIQMMQARKAMQEEGKSAEEIVAALEKDARFQ